MDPVVTGAIVGGAAAALGSFGSQWISSRKQRVEARRQEVRDAVLRLLAASGKRYRAKDNLLFRGPVGHFEDPGSREKAQLDLALQVAGAEDEYFLAADELDILEPRLWDEVGELSAATIVPEGSSSEFRQRYLAARGKLVLAAGELLAGKRDSWITKLRKRRSNRTVFPGHEEARRDLWGDGLDGPTRV